MHLNREAGNLPLRTAVLQGNAQKGAANRQCGPRKHMLAKPSVRVSASEIRISAY